MRRSYRHRCWTGCAVGFLLAASTACSLYKPDAGLEGAANVMPERYASDETDVATPTDYWQTFGAKDLNTLVQAALEHNRQIYAAAARMRAAGYGAWQAWSARFPEVRYSADVARTEVRSPAFEENRAEGLTWELGLAGGYELDLWGRVRSLHQAEEATLRQNRWDLQTMRMTVAAETALRWLEIVAARTQLALVARQLTAVSTTTELLELRYRQGNVPWTDVLAQRDIFYRLQERRHELEQRHETATAELQLLVGTHQVTATVTSTTLPALPPLPPTGLPADLVQQRPDVQSAWWAVRELAWQTAAARANRLPTFSLNGRFAYVAANPTKLFDSWVSSLVAGLAGPLLDFRGRKFAVEEAEAATEARLAQLQQTLLEAFRDVEVALAADRHLRARRRATQGRVTLNAQRLEQVRARYLQGAGGYIDVHVAELDYLDAQRANIALHADQLAQRVQLARALGGGWQKPEQETQREGA